MFGDFNTFVKSHGDEIQHGNVQTCFAYFI